MHSATKALFLPVLGLFLAFSTNAYAAPKVSARAEVFPVPAGRPIDLLVQIDPNGQPIQREGLTITAAPPSGVKTGGQPIFPPTPTGGLFEKPFVVRVPLELAPIDPFDDDGGTGLGGGENVVALTIKGQDKSGAAFELTTRAKLLKNEEPKGHVEVKRVSLESPAVAGKRNAIVVELVVQEKGYWVYGTQEPTDDDVVGVPITAELVRASGAAATSEWNGGWPVSPPGLKYKQGKPFELVIPFVPLREGKFDLRVFVRWQACNKIVCDPDEVAYVVQSVDVAPGDGTIETLARVTDSGSGLGDKSLWTLIGLAIGAALFALVMPCTYPMIPITISFFTKQAEQRHGKVMGLAMAYGLGIIAIFILIGVAVGGPIVQFAGLWWVNALFALLFLVFGLSLVGLFEIRLPSSFGDLASKASGTGGLLSVFAMGTTLVITSFTCTAPFVGSLLVYAGEAGSVWRVAFAMAVFGLTMAIPFVFLSLSPRALQALPRSGMWMKTLKVTLGIVELGLVLKFVSNIDIAIGTKWIPRRPFIFVWGLSFFVAALYLLDLAGLLKKSATWAAGKGRVITAVLLIAFSGYLWSGLDGTRLDKHLEAFFPPFGEKKYNEEAFLAVVREDYEAGLAEALRRKAPAFVHFTGFL